MAAHEQQPQDVVAVVRLVEPVRDGGFSASARSEIDVFFRQRLMRLLPAHLVDRGVLADQDQPGGRIARRTVVRPGLERPQASLLERLLGRVEIAEIAQQGGDRLRTRGSRAPRSIQPGSVTRGLPGKKRRSAGFRRRRRDWRAELLGDLERLVEDWRSRRYRSRAAAPWFRRTARR